MSLSRRQLFQADRDCLKQAIAGVVAIGIVDVLEMIQIEHEQRNTFIASARLGNRLREHLCHKSAIGEPGERIMQRHVMDACFGLFAFSNVVRYSHRADDPP